jgi:hypothetical protein
MRRPNPLLDQQSVRRAAHGLPALLVAVLRQLSLTTQWFPCDGRQGRRLRNSRTSIFLSGGSDLERAVRVDIPEWLTQSSPTTPPLATAAGRLVLMGVKAAGGTAVGLGDV